MTTGFTKNLEIVGVGFRAAVSGNVAIFNLGYSHQIEVVMPKGIDIKIDQSTKIEITGSDMTAGLDDTSGKVSTHAAASTGDDDLHIAKLHGARL